MTNHLKIGVIVVAVFTAAAAYAIEPPSLSGVIFTYFLYDLTSADEGGLEGGNEFGLGRCYVTAKGSVHDNVSYQITGDASRDSYTYYTYELVPDPETGENKLIGTPQTKTGKLGFFVKYAFVDVKDVIPLHHIRAGMIGPPYANYEHGLWGWRVIRKGVIDERGYGSTADLGVGVNGSFAGGIVEHDLAVLNGGSLTAAEDPYSGKDVEYRLSVFPLVGNEDWRGLSVNVLAKAENIGEKVPAGGTKTPVTIYGGMLGLKHEFANVGAGYYMSSAGDGAAALDGSAMSAFATVHLRATEGMTVHPLVRYDIFKPDTDDSELDRTLLIGGVGFKFFDGTLALIPNYQKESYKEIDALTGATEDKSIDYAYLHCQFDWK
jgi:hypothetical protein